jgi:transposase
MEEQLAACHRHDISDEVWAKIEAHLPGQRGQWGGIAKDNRKFINAVFWVLRTGAPWRDLPPSYGDWSNTHRRFSRWRNNGTWEKLLELFVNEEDFVWLMIDASHVKCHPDASGAVGVHAKACWEKRFSSSHFVAHQDMERTKGVGAADTTGGSSTPRYTWPWMRLVCRSECLLRQVPLRIVSLLGN